MAWTVAYITLLAIALVLGKPTSRVWVVMIANLIGTIVLHDNFLSVGILDLICVVFLLGHDRTQNTLALLFVLMLPVYVAGKYFGWEKSTTYAIVDLLAYIQLWVIGRACFGLSSFNRPPRGRRNLGIHFASTRRNAGHDPAMVPRSWQEINNGKR